MLRSQCPGLQQLCEFGVIGSLVETSNLLLARGCSKYATLKFTYRTSVALPHVLEDVDVLLH